MIKKNIILKITLILLFITTSAYSCGVYTTQIPIADISVSIDAKKSKTSFRITWEFKDFFIQSLQEHDRNKNGKFDLDEQKEIRDEYIGHLESNNYITELVYVKKGQRIRKSLINKINVKDSKLIFSDDGIKYYFDFDTDFVLENDHRLFIRFLDHTEKLIVVLKDVVVNNYKNTKVIITQDIRSNVYFYNYIPKHTKHKNHNHKDHKHGK